LLRDCRSVELRALCNDSPRTPPGPEGSNGNGSVSCAAEYPKFLLSFYRLLGTYNERQMRKEKQKMTGASGSRAGRVATRAISR